MTNQQILDKMAEQENATHFIQDFGDGPQDNTVGYPFEGTDVECQVWLLLNGYDRASDGKPRFAIGEYESED